MKLIYIYIYLSIYLSIYIYIYIYIYNKENQKGVRDTKSKYPKNIHGLHQEDTVNIGYEWRFWCFSIKLKIQTWRRGHVCFFSFILTNTRNVIRTLYSRCPLDKGREYFLGAFLLVLIALIWFIFCYMYIYMYTHTIIMYRDTIYNHLWQILRKGIWKLF